MYRINIEKQKLNFSSAHFITYENECEGLHGHNYYTMVEMEGTLDSNAYLMDFKQVKCELEKICKTLDHKVLMATENKHLKITQKDKSCEVVFKEKKYLFPSEDVVLLPMPNTTVEQLSKYIAGKLVDALEKIGMGENVRTIEVGVEETAGQMASFKTTI